MAQVSRRAAQTGNGKFGGKNLRGKDCGRRPTAAQTAQF
jgi:hypothetical protein